MAVSTRFFQSAIALLSLSALPALVSAHGHVTGININGQYIPGFPSDSPGSASPSTIAWSVNVPDNTFVRDYASPDIICHKQAAPARAHATVKAGGTVEFQWTQWPTHQGPVVDYMAACPGSCEDADKTQLQWFKIAERGLVSLTGCNVKGNTGCWALDELIQAGNRWSVTIPSELKAGNYVMRHEVINLDFPGQSQNYPACFNLAVTGGGSSLPEGVMGTSLYTGQEPGLNFDIYNMKSADYPIPGPPVASFNGGERTYPREYYGVASASVTTLAPAETTPPPNDTTPSPVDTIPSQVADGSESDSDDDDDTTCESYPAKRARRWVA